jgi:hypothetical protein
MRTIYCSWCEVVVRTVEGDGETFDGMCQTCHKEFNDEPNDNGTVPKMPPLTSIISGQKARRVFVLRSKPKETTEESDP